MSFCFHTVGCVTVACAQNYMPNSSRFPYLCSSLPSFNRFIQIVSVCDEILKQKGLQWCSSYCVQNLCWVTWIWLMKLACFCNKLFIILPLDTARFVKLDDSKPSPEIARYNICQQSRQLLWLYTHGLTLTLKSWVEFLAFMRAIYAWSLPEADLNHHHEQNL